MCSIVSNHSCLTLHSVFHTTCTYATKCLARVWVGSTALRACTIFRLVSLSNLLASKHPIDPSQDSTVQWFSILPIKSTKSALSCFLVYSVEYLLIVVYQPPNHAGIMKWTCTSTFQMTGITLELYYQFHYRNEENDPPGKPPVTERGYRCAVQLWSSKDGRIKYSESASIEEDGRGHISFPSVEPGGYSVLVALSSDVQPKLFCAENHISISPIVKHSISTYHGKY